VNLRTAPSAAIPVIVAFYVAVMLAPSHRLTLLVSGTVGIAACWIIAGRRGVDPGAGQEMIGIFLAACIAIAMPVAFQAPIPVRTMAAEALGILAIEATWAARCFPVFPPARPQSALRRARTGVLFGVLMAIGVSLIATVPLAAALLLAGAAERAEVRAVAPLIYAAYLVGGVGAGLVVGLLRPLSRWPLGTMLLGVLGGICIYGAIGPVAELARPPISSIPEMIGIALACGLLAGPPAALGLRYNAAAVGEFKEYAV
jgi:hypothetical protein